MKRMSITSRSGSFKLKSIHERIKAVVNYRVAPEASSLVLVSLEKALDRIAYLAEQALETENKARVAYGLKERMTINLDDVMVALKMVFTNEEEQK